MLLKAALFIAVFVISVSTQIAMADETVTEKVTATTNTAKRTIKKGAHRVQEAVCAEGDVKCASKKIKNRAVEAKDATVDGVKEIKHKVD